MSRLRLAARLACREVRRRPGRTALVTVLVALPVSGMVLALVLIRTDRLTPEEEWQRYQGNADALLSPSGPDGTELDASGLPAGSRVLTVESGWTRARTVDGNRSDLSIRGFAAGDPMLRDLIELVAGRLPTAGDEVALAPSVASDLGVDVGDRLSLDRPEIELDVVGLVEDPAHLGDATALVAPGGDLLDAGLISVDTPYGLVDLPDGMAPGRELAANPNVLLRREFTSSPFPQSMQVPWPYVIGAVALTVVGIVIAAAFAAGARRQLVMLGQLSASGAPGPVLRSTLVLQGTVTGLVGSAVGLALAGGVLAGARPTLERLLGHRLGAYDVRATEIGGAALVGVVAATVAALVPAWSISRIPTLTALAGRRPLPPVRHRVTAAGALAVVAGVGLLGLAVLGSATGEDTEIWALVAITGGVLELLGACAMAPAVVARLEPLAGRTRGSWRLASRSLARQRGRTGAVVSAVAAAAGLAVAATALVAGNEAGQTGGPVVSDNVVVVSEIEVPDAKVSTSYYERPAPPDDAVRDEISSALPGARTVTMRTAGTQADWPDLRVPVVADDEVLDALEIDAAVRRALDEAGVVVLDDGYAQSHVTLPDGRMEPLPSVASDHGLGNMWGALASPSLVDELGLGAPAAALAYVVDEPLTSGQADDIGFLSAELSGAPGADGSYVDFSVRWPESGPTPVQVELILTGVALLFAVLVVGASLALAAAESRDERDVLTVAGVAPRTLAASAGAKAWLLAGIGVAMAVPVGLLPVAVFVAADDGAARFVVPWRPIGLLALALPVVVAAVALAASATAQRLRPVRVSTAVFE
jgi:putative ABC transport system permease protein